MKTCDVERWLPICSTDGAYEVSDHGRVRSVKRVDRLGRVWKGRILSVMQRRSDGRCVVSLSVGGVARPLRISTLVLEAFVGPRPTGMEACHYPDRDVRNNNLSNLRWGTKERNELDKLEHGTVLRGETQPNSKLKERDVRLAFELSARGLTQKEIAESIGVHPSTISYALSKKTWAHVSTP